MPKWFALVFLMLNVLVSYAQATDVIRYNISVKHPDPKQAYNIELLDLALKQTVDEFGPYELKAVVYEMPQGRTSIMVEQEDAIDVVWRMTSQTLETKLQAIYIPLLKGLMGFRVFIINKEDQTRFSKTMPTATLKSYTAGQGLDWPDSQILQHNGFNVIKGSAIKLISMLKRQRFDYFPRAIHEPWTEIKNEPSLSVESNFLLKYTAPMYFFVNKQNKYLHRRIASGLNTLIKNGEFDTFLYSHPITANIIKKAKLADRRIIQLDNPLLSEKTRQLQKHKPLWIQ